VITAIREVAAGEELHLSYGIKSNARLLSGYGFCLPDNPADVARIVLPRSVLDVRGDLIARLLWDRPLGSPWQVQITRQLDGDTARALSHARLAVATDREFLTALDRGRIRTGGVPWISECNEAAAGAALAGAAATRLAEIPAELDGGATPFERARKLLLSGERQVLEALIACFAEASLLLPRASRWDLRRAGDAAQGRLLGPYLQQLATELA
jgi:hypothetical protein